MRSSTKTNAQLNKKSNKRSNRKKYEESIAQSNKMSCVKCTESDTESKPCAESKVKSLEASSTKSNAPKSIGKSSSESNEKSYMYCHLCPPSITFSSLTAYRSHMAKHANENWVKYVCGICDARFKWKSELDKHLIEFGHQNKHTCDTCDARFSRKKEKDRHMTKFGHRMSETNFTCDICKAQFTMKKYLSYVNSICSCPMPSRVTSLFFDNFIAKVSHGKTSA